MGKSSKKILTLFPLFTPIAVTTLSSACTNGLVDDSSHVINKITKLENLSNRVKNDYKNRILRTDNVNELYAFLKEAKNENELKTNAIGQIQKYDLHIFSKKAKQIIIEKIKDLVPDNVDVFLNEVNNIKVVKETILKNIKEKENYFQKYNFDVTPFKAKIADITETESLENIKQNVSLEITRYVSMAKIESIQNLSVNIKNNYKNEILKSQDINKILDILNQAKNENELKTNAISQIQKYDIRIFSEKAKQTLFDEVKNLESDKINSFLSNIDKLKKNKEVILKNINDNENYFEKYDFNSTIFKEKIANITDFMNLKTIEKDVLLEIARYKALSQIDDIKNLSNDAKNNYKTEILKSNSIDEIDLIIKQAMKVSGVELKKSIARVEVNKLQFISQNEKEQFKKYINDLDTEEKVDESLNAIISKDKNKEKIYNEKIKVSDEFEREYIESIKQKFINSINENDYQNVANDFFNFSETKKRIKKELQALTLLNSDAKSLLLQKLTSLTDINDVNNLRDYQVKLDKSKQSCLNNSLALSSIEWDKSKSGSKHEEIKRHIINAETVEMLDKIFSQLVYADDTFKTIRDSFTDVDDAKYNISHDEREIFLKKVVAATKDEIDKLLMQFNDLARSKENERLNDLSTHLELKLKTYDADIITKTLDGLSLNDFDNNVMNQKFISLSEISKQYDAISKVLTFILKFESKRFDGKSIFLHKDGKIKITNDVYDIKKSYKQQYDLVINGYKTGQSYQEYKQKIISNIDKIENEIKAVNPKCKAEVIAKIKEQHNIFSQKIEKSFLECAEQSICEFIKFIQDDQQLNIDIYNHLNNMFDNTNKELLDVFAKLGKSEKKTPKRLLYQRDLARDWVLAETVGKWATSIFTNLFNSIKVFERVIDLSFNRLKTKYSLTNDKAAKIVEVSKRILLYMLSYFKDLKWDYLIHNDGEKQNEYDNKTGGKTVLLMGGWGVLFDTEKFLVPKYSDPSGKDLDTELQNLVTQKIITDDEKLIFFKEIKYIFSPFTKSIDNYNKKIKGTMISGLGSSFKIINDAK